MDLAEQILEVARDRDLVNGMSDLAALHQKPRGTARIVAGHRVDALAEQFADDERLVAIFDEVLQRTGCRLHE